MLFAEAAPLTLIAGALSWHLVEKHFLNRASKLKHEGIETLPAQSPLTPAIPPVAAVQAPHTSSNESVRPSEGEAYAAAKL
jgi:peptidoglycan/LPS O-acetylase OafA/YrhL